MRIADEKLSEHFWLSEFVRSIEAERAGIDNTPSPATVILLRANAQNMELLRGVLGVPVHVLSGYRCEALERLLTKIDFPAWCERHGMTLEAGWKVYFERKQHPKGAATDFVAPGYGPPLMVARRIVESASPAIRFDQLILEHSWVHVSWPLAGQAPRAEVLTQLAGGAYARGLVATRVAA